MARRNENKAHTTRNAEHKRTKKPNYVIHDAVEVCSAQTYPSQHFQLRVHERLRPP